jgi:hypothetical protein
MKKVKLARLPDRAPVKMQVTLPPDLAARLRDYADLYAETYGVREEPADLVPYMLNAFLNGDAEFRKAMREKTAKDEASSVTDEIHRTPVSPIADEPLSGSGEEVRELRKLPRLAEQRSDGLSD